MKDKKILFFKQIPVILMVTLLFSMINYSYGKNKKLNKKDQLVNKKWNKKDHLVITYDFFKGKLTDGRNERFIVWFRRNVTFKVINVNPFLYKTTIDGKEFDYFSGAPRTFSEISKEALGIKSKEKDPKEVKKDAKEVKDNIINEKKEEKEKKKKKNENEEVKKLEEAIKKIETDFEDINEFLSAYEAVSKIITFHKSFRHILFKNETFEVLQTRLNDFLESRWDKKGIKIDNVIWKFSQLQEEANQKYGVINFKRLQKESCNNPDLKKMIEQLQNYKKNLEKIENSKIIDKISGLINKFQKKNFERSVLIPNVESDEIRITAKIDPLDKNNDEVHQKIVGPVRVRVKRGWTMNFSTGVLFHINAHNHTYRLDTVEDDSTKVIIRENKDNKSITPAVSALMHIYPRSVRSVKWGGITFGIGTNDTEKINYYIGTSYMFGFKRRFVINAGLVVTKIDVLKPEYEIGQKLDINENIKPENLVRNDFRPRFYIGFTYNLTQKEK